MAKIQFIEKRFGRASMELIEKVNSIVGEYRRQGYRLSLRQLYYQLVARDIIENTVQSYKRIGSIVSDARDAGLIDWNAIEDRGRVPFLPTSWTDPAEIINACANGFRLDRWEGQENVVEVMVEKDALSGILRPVCSRYHVRFTANKGYSSSTAMFDAGERVYNALSDPDGTANEYHFIYFGDHDPSGLDMTRDIQERIAMYSRLDPQNVEEHIHIHRLALNYDQVELWNPPPNPAKETDSRFIVYRDQYGDESWELDAVEPSILANLVTDQIRNLIDWSQWAVIEERETRYTADLQKISKAYEAGTLSYRGKGKA